MQVDLSKRPIAQSKLRYYDVKHGTGVQYFLKELSDIWGIIHFLARSKPL